MEFYLNESIQLSILLIFYKGMYAAEGNHNPEKAEEYIEGALKLSLASLEGCYATNFANAIKIRLYYAKLLVHRGQLQKAKDLILDNIKDTEIELCLRQNNNPTCFHHPKAQKCVVHVYQRSNS